MKLFQNLSTNLAEVVKSLFLFIALAGIFFQGLHLTICLLRLGLSTPLRCNKMRLAGNLLSFCALYVDALVKEKNTFKGFSIFSSGGHLVQWSGTV